MEKEEPISFNELFSSDDEIYTFQCPNFLKKNSIKEIFSSSHMKTINRESQSEKKEQLKVQVLRVEKEYVTIASPMKPPENSMLFRIPLKGHILIQKPSDPNQTNDKSFMTSDEKFPMIFPTDLNLGRHPLLGVSWKSHTEIANKAINKNPESYKQLFINGNTNHNSYKHFNAKARKRISATIDTYFQPKKNKK